MTQYSRDFNNASSVITGFSRDWDTAGGVWSIRSSIYDGTRVLAWYPQSPVGAAGSLNLLRWTDVPTSADFEVLTLWRIYSEGYTLIPRSSTVVRVDPGSTRSFYDAYFPTVYNSQSGNMVNQEMSKVISSSRTNLGGSTKLPRSAGSGTWKYTRTQVVGTTIRTRSWPQGWVEPSSWDFEATDSGLATGGVGLMGYSLGTAVDYAYTEFKYMSVGTAGDPAPGTIVVDTPPVITIEDNPAAGSTSDSPFLNAALAHSKSTNIVEYQLDGGAWTRPDANTASNSDLYFFKVPVTAGAHSYSIRSTDLPGNVTVVVPTTNWTVTSPDVTPPVVRIISGVPSNGTTIQLDNTNTTQLIMRAKSSEPGACWITMNGGTSWTLINSAGTYTQVYSFGNYGPGTYQVQYRSQDAAGNFGYSETRNFTILADTSAPNAGVITANSTPPGMPAEGASTVRTRISWSASSPGTSGGWSYRYYLDNVLIFDTTSSSTGFGASGNNGPLSVGPHQLKLQLYDGLGNTSTTIRSWTIVADTAPLAPAVTPGTGVAALTNQTSASFSFGSSLPYAVLQYRLDGGAWTALGTATEAARNSVTTPTFTGLAMDSVHTFEARILNEQGQAGAVTTYSWEVVSRDITPPMITFTTVPAATGVAAGFFTFTVTLSEPGTVEYKINGHNYQPAYTATGTVHTWTASAEAGSCTLTVRATDLEGISGTNSYSWATTAGGGYVAPSTGDGKTRANAVEIYATSLSVFGAMGGPYPNTNPAVNNLGSSYFVYQFWAKFKTISAGPAFVDQGLSSGGDMYLYLLEEDPNTGVLTMVGVDDDSFGNSKGRIPNTSGTYNFKANTVYYILTAPYNNNNFGTGATVGHARFSNAALLSGTPLFSAAGRTRQLANLIGI